MVPPIDTKQPLAVQAEVQQVYDAMFPQGNRAFVPAVFRWVTLCFDGKYRDYLPIDARYHDLEHTLQGTLCLARLLRGRHSSGAAPLLTERMFQLGIFAILLHDTGYLKKRNDTEGTGAKYTITHVGRSADFAAELLSEKKLPPTEILAVQNMIRCTGVNADLEAIPFQSELERIAGFSLASADLLGQMAAEDYVDKLPTLYEEFAEATNFSHEQNHFIATFKSAADLAQRTPVFWEKFVLTKLDRDFDGVYRFLNQPYPDGPNYYLDRIAANLARLKQHPAAK